MRNNLLLSRWPCFLLLEGEETDPHLPWGIKSVPILLSAVETQKNDISFSVIVLLPMLDAYTSACFLKGGEFVEAEANKNIAGRYPLF